MDLEDPLAVLLVALLVLRDREPVPPAELVVAVLARLHLLRRKSADNIDDLNYKY